MDSFKFKRMERDPAGDARRKADAAASAEGTLKFLAGQVSNDNEAAPRGPAKAARRLKVVCDLVAAGMALVVLAPVFVVIAAIVKLDGGPVFFAHRRIGAEGRIFHCLKFRSMVVDAEQALRRLLISDPAAAAEWEASRKLRHDPRITRVGRVLRATSLDELPQLVNVLKRDMSLVGPRPISESEVKKYGDQFEVYASVKPGLTGLWQTSGRSDTSYSERVKLDVSYVRNWSFWADMQIIARTVPAVLRREGAH